MLVVRIRNPIRKRNWQETYRQLQQRSGNQPLAKYNADDRLVVNVDKTTNLVQSMN